jgi:drug/metabolite transporter (DMT)-like permease
MHVLGIIFALFALVSWGIGDFLIQKTSRDYGIWPSIFCVAIFGSVVLFPFVYTKIPFIIDSANIWFMFILGIGTLLAGLATFDSLKQGKIAIVEPILSFELPVTIFLAVILIHEKMSLVQILLVVLIFSGILLLSYNRKAKARHFLEKGALLAVLAALLQAGVNFITGLSSKEIGPVETIWFVDTFVACACLFYFTVTRTWHSVIEHIHQHTYESIGVAVFDNAAWVAYSAATVIIPISLAVTISESYVIVTILLGVILSRERLVKHQWVGVVVTIISVLILSSISS